MDQPDITGIVPLSKPVYPTHGSSTIRMQTQSSTSMYLGSTDRQPLQGVWSQRQRSEPPAVRPSRPRQPQPVWQPVPNYQQPAQQSPGSWQQQTVTQQTEMSRSFTSGMSPAMSDSVMSPAPTIERPPSRSSSVGWQPVPAPQQKPVTVTVQQAPVSQYQQPPVSQYQQSPQITTSVPAFNLQQSVPQTTPVWQPSQAQMVWNTR